MLKISYRDELGIVIEEVDEYGVSFADGKAYFNDKTIPMEYVVAINKEFEQGEGKHEKS